ncbi:hypothetical protein PM082_007556 [Marasmius tenuissimus]|nr:hypothetical protein PM082_007556 [Marasmius tenuissimus]
MGVAGRENVGPGGNFGPTRIHWHFDYSGPRSFAPTTTEVSQNSRRDAFNHETHGQKPHKNSVSNISGVPSESPFNVVELVPGFVLVGILGKHLSLTRSDEDYHAIVQAGGNRSPLTTICIDLKRFSFRPTTSADGNVGHRKAGVPSSSSHKEQVIEPALCEKGIKFLERGLGDMPKESQDACMKFHAYHLHDGGSSLGDR